MTDLDLSGMRTFVLGCLDRGLSPALTYHCIEHTRDDVVPAALRLAARAGLNANETALLETGAWFHDLGFVERAIGHEDVGIRFAGEHLPRFGFDAAQIALVATLIAATKSPSTPTSHLAELLADADLDVLGRHDFFARNDALRQEVAALGAPLCARDWYTQQLTFLTEHQYFTPQARALRDPQKAENVAEMRRRLTALES